MAKTERTYNAAGREMCGAQTTDGTPCEQDKLYPNGRCYYHGGPSPGGIAHWNYKGAGRSKDLPPRLRETYETALLGGELLSSLPNIAQLEARIAELNQSLSTGESGANWKALREACGALREANAQRPPDLAAASAALNEIFRTVNAGANDAEVNAELLKLFDAQRKQRDTETRREERSVQTLAAGRVILLVQAAGDAIQQAVHEYVNDEKLARNILSEARARLVRLLSGTSSGFALPAGGDGGGGEPAP